MAATTLRPANLGFVGPSRTAWFFLFIFLAYLLPALSLFLWFIFVDQDVAEVPVLKAVPTLTLIGLAGSAALFLVRPYELFVRMLPAPQRERLEAGAPIQRRQRQSLYWGYSFALPWRPWKTNSQPWRAVLAGSRLFEARAPKSSGEMLLVDKHRGAAHVDVLRRGMAWAARARLACHPRMGSIWVPNAVSRRIPSIRQS